MLRASVILFKLYKFQKKGELTVQVDNFVKVKLIDLFCNAQQIRRRFFFKVYRGGGS